MIVVLSVGVQQNVALLSSVDENITAAAAECNVLKIFAIGTA